MKRKVRKNAAAVACAAVMICAAGAVPNSMLSTSLPVQAAETTVQTSLPQVTGLTSKTPDISSIKLSWNAVYGADGYSVCMRSKGQYPEIADVTDTTYLVTGLPAATRENFKVRAYKIVNGQKVYGDYSVNYNSATNPRPVSGLKAQTGNASVSLSWNKVGCSNYRVFMLKNGKWTQIAQTDSNSYTVTGLGAGSYTFKVRACKRDDKGANHYGKYSQEITAQAVKVDKVTGLTSKTPNTSSIKLSWNAVSGADGYSVGMRSKGQYPEIADVTDTTYLVTGLPAATRENFKVRAYKIVNGQKVYGSYSVNYNSATNPRPISGLKAQTGNASVSLSWNKVSCSNYRVFMLKNGKWTQIAQTDTNSYTVTGLDAGSYTFKVRACKRDDKGANHYGKYSQEITAQAVKVDKVTGLTSKTPNTSSIKLSWNAVSGADGYSVGMRSKGQYPEIADVTDTTYLVTGLPAATRENFKVRAYKIVDGVKIYSDYSDNYNSATNPRQVTGVKASDITASTLDLNWKSVGCTSYKVFIYTNGKWKSIASSTVNSCAINGLYAKTAYKFKVRACKTDDKGSNHYGAYSAEITVKTPDHTVEVINGMSYVDGVLLANKTYSLPASYDPKGLTKETSAAFKKMQTAAYKDGISLWVCSGYRSYYDQKYLYNMYCNRDGKAAADTYSARPGYSDHQTGMAIDVNNASDSFGGTKEAKWLANNCAKYGFIIRYPKGKEASTGYKYEPWHIRYVGVPLAQNIVYSGLSLEEYFGITSQYKD